MGLALPFHVSRHTEQQGVDWILANPAFGCGFFWPDYAEWPEFCGQPIRVRSSRTQLRIPASQLLDLDTCAFPPLRRTSDYIGGIGVRNALRVGLSQSVALA